MYVNVPRERGFAIHSRAFGNCALALDDSHSAFVTIDASPREQKRDSDESSPEATSVRWRIVGLHDGINAGDEHTVFDEGKKVE